MKQKRTNRSKSLGKPLHIGCGEGGADEHRVSSVIVESQLCACWLRCCIVGVFVVSVRSAGYSNKQSVDVS
jgi:hypothetical protein